MRPPNRTISRTDLYARVWAEPLTKLAESFGISDVGLRKICQRHDIPLPPQGYRQRAQAGRVQNPTPLPRASEPETIDLPASPATSQFATDLMREVYGVLIEAEDRPDRRLTVSGAAEPKHPIARRISKALKACAPDKYGAVVYDGPEPFKVRVPPASVTRAVRLVDALALACDARALEIRTGDASRGQSGIMIAGEAERLAIEEASRKQLHWSTEAEKARTRRLGYSTAPIYDFVPSGVMTVQISTAVYRDGVRSVWKDGKTRPVEDCLNDIMVGLYRSSHASAVDRLKGELRQRRADEENARRSALRAERAAARQQLETLEAQAAAWSRAQGLRAFIAARAAAHLNTQGELDAAAAAWIEQAQRHADRIDPLTPTPVSALDYDEADLRPISPWQIRDD